MEVGGVVPELQVSTPRGSCSAGSARGVTETPLRVWAGDGSSQEGRARWRHRVCSAGSASLGPAGQGRAVLGQHSREGQSWLSPAAPWAGLAVGAVTSQQLGMFSGAIPSVLCHGLCLGGPEGRALGHPELLLGHQGFPGREWRLPVPPVPFLFPVGRKQQALRLGPSL